VNPVAQLRSINDHGHEYQALVFWCLGCEVIDSEGERQAGAHMLPVTGDSNGRPMWDFDGNLDAPTLSPSILSRSNRAEPLVCHSFMRAGQMEFLGDCTHALAGQTVPLPPLPDWLLRETS
jgi:hypothetical protein